MPKVSSGLACPYCDAQGANYELYSLPPTPALFCESGNQQHTFNDTSVLNSMNPRKLAVKPKADVIQIGHVPIHIHVPASTAEALKTKFGERLSSSLTSVLQACAESRMLILSTADLQRLEERLGPSITSSAELFGRVFALGEQKKEATNELERILRTTNRKRGVDVADITVELGDFLGKAMQMAAESGQDVDEFLSKYLQNSLENDWITVS